MPIHGKCYVWPAEYITPTNTIYEKLKEWRKEFIKDQETFIQYQKNTKDKFFKECAREALKLQRACTFMIPWFGGDTKAIPPVMWPADLAPELDRIARRIVLL